MRRRRPVAEIRPMRDGMARLLADNEGGRLVAGVLTYAEELGWKPDSGTPFPQEAILNVHVLLLLAALPSNQFRGTCRLLGAISGIRGRALQQLAEVLSNYFGYRPNVHIMLSRRSQAIKPWSRSKCIRDMLREMLQPGRPGVPAGE